MIILNLEPLNFSKSAIRLLSKKYKYYSLSSLNKNKHEKLIEASNVIILRLAKKIDKKFLDKAINLKYIVSPTTGLNHIDLSEAKKRDIKIISLKDEKDFLKQITSTAELTISLIFEYFRKTGRAAKFVEDNGVWDRDKYRGQQLSGKSIGIIGMGRLGKIVSEYALSLRMKVYYFDPFIKINNKKIKNCSSLKDCLQISDIVSLHINYSDENKNFFNKERFTQMKNDALFVNTARGELVCEDALLDALKNKIIGGAALDVLADENSATTNARSHKLIKFARKNENLIITPHIGGACNDAMDLVENFIINKLLKILEFDNR